MQARTGEGTRRLVEFGRALRAEDLAVGTGRVEQFCRATSLLPPADLYWAGRATLLARHEEIPVYDRVFRVFFGGEAPTPELAAPQAAKAKAASRDDADSDEGEELSETTLLPASGVEALREKSFAACTAEELAQLGLLMSRLRPVVPTRRSRRRRPARSGAPDLRRTIRRSFRTAGEPLERFFRKRERRRRRLVLFLDVSGSMTAYSRALVLFAHAALKADRRWEAFGFGTRLTRLTKALATSDADEALTRAASEVFDWDGGTRIGDSLKAFLGRHAEVARGAVVVICSDGLDIGDPVLLEKQMGRLARLAYRVVWLNPLKEDPACELPACGMRAMPRHVDVFGSGHNLASLEALGVELEQM